MKDWDKGATTRDVAKLLGRIHPSIAEVLRFGLLGRNRVHLTQHATCYNSRLREGRTSKLHTAGKPAAFLLAHHRVKIRDPFSRFLIMRIRISWGLYWAPFIKHYPILGAESG